MDTGRDSSEGRGPMAKMQNKNDSCQRQVHALRGFPWAQGSRWSHRVFRTLSSELSRGGSSQVIPLLAILDTTTARPCQRLCFVLALRPPLVT